MTKSNWISIWGAVIGLFITAIGSSLLLGFRIGVIDEKITSMERTLEDLPGMKADLTEMKVKLDVLWRVHLSRPNSSIGLNDEDRDALKKSKIESLISDLYGEILSTVMALKPDNAQQTQELLISVVNGYKKSDDYRQLIQQAVVMSGYDVDSLLLVAALSIREKVVRDLGFSLSD